MLPIFVINRNRMIDFPNAKINLGLYITSKRPDGFHNIETIFVPVPTLCDILEIIPSPNSGKPLIFSQTGLTVKGDVDSNLCVNAHRILSSHTSLPKVSMHLHKQIPMGAGLGGGSADGAFALRMLNELADNPLPSSDLSQLALELGSDCPFFLVNKPCFATGRGEILNRVNLPISNMFIMLVNPNIHVDTGLAFRKSTPQLAATSLAGIAEIPLERWKNTISNDFEKGDCAHHKQVKSIKDKLYDSGAVYCSMSGSGGTVFAIYRAEPPKGLFNEPYFLKTVKM